jgi:hypothetical protein
MIGIKSGEFKKTLKVGSGLFELVVDQWSRPQSEHSFCVLQNSNEAGDALAVVSHPMLVIETHFMDCLCGRKSWLIGHSSKGGGRWDKIW